MSFFQAIWTDLREKRLWPIAVGLIAAIIAVPVVLAKSGSKTPSSPAPAIAGGAHPSQDPGLPVISVETSVAPSSLRGLSKHDPFTQQTVTTSTTTTASTSTAATGTGTTGSTGSAGSTTGGGTGTSTVPTHSDDADDPDNADHAAVETEPGLRGADRNPVLPRDGRDYRRERRLQHNRPS